MSEFLHIFFQCRVEMLNLILSFLCSNNLLKRSKQKLSVGVSLLCKFTMSFQCIYFLIWSDSMAKEVISTHFLGISCTYYYLNSFQWFKSYFMPMISSIFDWISLLTFHEHFFLMIQSSFFFFLTHSILRILCTVRDLSKFPKVIPFSLEFFSVSPHVLTGSNSKIWGL